MPQTVVITGANRGIGLALARLYAKRGDRVIGACRKSSPELQAVAAQVIEGIDVGTESGAAALAKALGDTQIDLLINNAGILRRESLDEMNVESIREQFAVNALGPLLVTHALLRNLHQGSKLAFVTSRMGSIADNTSGSRYGYRMSKAALNMAAVSLAHDLQPRGIPVAILHPGFVQTDMVGGSGDISADTAAERLAARIDGLNLENSGTFWHSNGDVLPW